MNTTPPRQNPPKTSPGHYEAILLSKIVSQKKDIKILFLDSEILVGKLKWHTPYHLGMADGKVVYKSAVKFWETID